MMKGILAFLIFITLYSCKPSDEKQNKLASAATKAEEGSVIDPKGVLELDGKSIYIYDFDGLEPLLHKDDNVTYVVNFWATWCKPCVEELPGFETLNEKYKESNIKVILVSLDFPRMYESRLLPFIKKEKLQSEVVVLDDPKQNKWIPKVSEEWSGAIPATLIYNKEKRKFFEQSFSYEELENTIQSFIN